MKFLTILFVGILTVSFCEAAESETSDTNSLVKKLVSPFELAVEKMRNNSYASLSKVDNFHMKFLKLVDSRISDLHKKFTSTQNSEIAKTKFCGEKNELELEEFKNLAYNYFDNCKENLIRNFDVTKLFNEYRDELEENIEKFRSTVADCIRVNPSNSVKCNSDKFEEYKLIFDNLYKTFNEHFKKFEVRILNYPAVMVECVKNKSYEDFQVLQRIEEEFEACIINDFN